MSTHFRVARTIPRFVSAGAGSHTYRDAVLADSPVLYWRLGEASGTTITDISGNSRNGTYANSPTLGVAGAVTDGDTAVTFNGTTQQGALAYASWMSTLCDNNFTLEAWYKGTGVSQVIFGRGSSNTVGYIAVDASGHAFMQARHISGGNVTCIGTSTVNDGNWHHIAGANRKGEGMFIFVDGAQENTTVTTVAMATDTVNGLYVGSRNGSAFLAGSVDECAAYATGMVEAQIAAHYAAR